MQTRLRLFLDWGIINPIDLIQWKIRINAMGQRCTGNEPSTANTAFECTWVNVSMKKYSRHLQMIAKSRLKQYKGKWIPANQTQNLPQRQLHSGLEEHLEPVLPTFGMGAGICYDDKIVGVADQESRSQSGFTQ